MRSYNVSMIPLERLSPQAMMVISNARQEAKRSGNQLVGTEHILLGIVTCEDAKVHDVIKEVGLTEQLVRKVVMEIVTTSREPHTRDDLDFTPRAKRMMSSGVAEADLLGETLVQPKHIFIAMLREDYGLASRILERTQVNTVTLLKSLLK
jgi:ATP-dependent Clp protease ATP-binding subunit ClpC